MADSSAATVCHLTSAHGWQDTRIFLKECSSLTRVGYKVHLVAPAAPDETKNGVILHGVNRSSGSRLIRFTKTVFDVYRRAVAIDATLYHFHDPELISVALLLKWKGKKVIYDSHEDFPRVILERAYIPKMLRKPLSFFFECFENFAVRRFDGVVAATPAIAKRFLSVTPRTTNVNNYPIQEELFVAGRLENPKERAVCYVGALVEIKGLIEMVQAVGLADVPLLLGGQLSSQELRSKVESLSGWSNVRHLGQLDRAGVTETLGRSIAGLVVFHPVPNYVDARPIKMFEYMSAGIPVIASDFPAWKEIIEGCGCGMCVDPSDPKAIAAAIDYVVSNSDIAKEMGRRGRLAVEQVYNWQRESEKLLEVYSRVLGSELKGPAVAANI